MREVHSDRCPRDERWDRSRLSVRPKPNQQIRADPCASCAIATRDAPTRSPPPAAHRTAHRKRRTSTVVDRGTCGPCERVLFPFRPQTIWLWALQKWFGLDRRVRRIYFCSFLLPLQKWEGLSAHFFSLQKSRQFCNSFLYMIYGIFTVSSQITHR